MNQLIFSPCEKVLQDSDLGHSLISVFHEIKVQLPIGAEVPHDAVIPKEWAVFSKWELSAEDEGKPYEFTLKIYWPDGKLWAEQSLNAAQPTKTALVFAVRLQGFPFGQIGKLRIASTLRSNGVLVSSSQFHISVNIVKDLVIPPPE